MEFLYKILDSVESIQNLIALLSVLLTILVTILKIRSDFMGKLHETMLQAQKWIKKEMYDDAGYYQQLKEEWVISVIKRLYPISVLFEKRLRNVIKAICEKARLENVE